MAEYDIRVHLKDTGREDIESIIISIDLIYARDLFYYDSQPTLAQA